MSPSDPLAEQRIAAVRLFLFATPCIPPTVRAEAETILNPDKLEEHIRFINYSFIELLPDASGQSWIDKRVEELHPYHKGLNDRQIVAEVEHDGNISVFVTFDGMLKKDLAPHVNIRIETPVECWNGFRISPGTPPPWVPAPQHPLARETWWRW